MLKTEIGIGRTTGVGQHRGPITMSAFLFFMLTNLALTFFANAHSMADAIDERGDKIKSAVVFQVTKFISWDGIAADPDTLRFCVYENGALSREVAKMSHNKEVGGRMVKVSSLAKATIGLGCEKSNSDCDVVFLDRTSSSPECLRGGKIPSICGVKEVVWDGCMVQVFEESNKARIAIDLNVSEALNVRISSELLSLARVNSKTSD